MVRNLARYPITYEEKLQALDWAVHQAGTTFGDMIGNLTAASLGEVKEDLEAMHTASEKQDN